MFNALPWLTDKEAGAEGSKELAAAPEEAEEAAGGCAEPVQVAPFKVG